MYIVKDFYRSLKANQYLMYARNAGPIKQSHTSAQIQRKHEPATGRREGIFNISLVVLVHFYLTCLFCKFATLTSKFVRQPSLIPLIRKHLRITCFGNVLIIVSQFFSIFSSFIVFQLCLCLKVIFLKSYLLGNLIELLDIVFRLKVKNVEVL